MRTDCPDWWMGHGYSARSIRDDMAETQRRRQTSGLTGRLGDMRGVQTACALNTQADQAQDRVQTADANHKALGSHVVVMDAGTPLAMTGLNAQISVLWAWFPDSIGTDNARALRGQCDAGRESGFRQIGEWTLLLLKDKETLPWP